MTVVMLMAASFSCNDIGIDDDHSTISDPLSRWHAYRITSYSLKQSLTCFCVGGGVTMRVVVKDNRIVNVLEIATGNSIPQNRREYYKTVDELFTIAQGINPDSVAHFVIEYDQKYGLPTTLYVDPDEGVADEEFGYQTQFLSRD